MIQTDLESLILIQITLKKPTLRQALSYMKYDRTMIYTVVPGQKAKLKTQMMVISKT